jgi:hypothetical protein
MRSLMRNLSQVGRLASRGTLAALLATGMLPAVGLQPAAAHHGWTGYDSSTPLTLSGTIVEVEYSNPHVMIKLEIPPGPEPEGVVEFEEEEEGIDDDQPVVLLVVLAPPFRSEARGMPREAFQIGVPATVEGYLHKQDHMELRAERITIGDTTVELR